MHLHSSPLTVPKANSTGIEDKESFMMKKMTIANALAPHLSEDRLEEALIIWEHKYAHQPTFALQRFISEFCDNNVQGQRSKILQALFLALNNSTVTQAAEEPAPVVNKNIEAAPVTQGGATAIFEQLLAAILSGLNHDLNQRVRLEAQHQLKHLKANAVVRRDLMAFFSQGYSLPTSFYIEIKTMRECINLVYIALCEVLGPVKADDVLHNAIQRIEKQPNNRFSVRELL
jgi:hypothetical protein